MPARDHFHEAVIRGLRKQNWTVIDDPLYIAKRGQARIIFLTPNIITAILLD
jgi:hypothetical protein